MKQSLYRSFEILVKCVEGKRSDHEIEAKNCNQIS